jgi:hypothetical protein
VQTTHGLQTWAGAADDVQRQKSPTTLPRQAIYGDAVRRDIAPRTVPRTRLVQNSKPSATNGERQRTRQLHAVLERNPKRGRGSDGEYQEPTTTAASQGDIGTPAENDSAPKSCQRWGMKITTRPLFAQGLKRRDALHHHHPGSQCGLRMCLVCLYLLKYHIFWRVYDVEHAHAHAHAHTCICG